MFFINTIKSQNLQFSVLTGPIFFKKKGNTELKSLYITCRLMLIDICFMKISYTVSEIQRGFEACMIDGQTSELKLLP